MGLTHHPLPPAGGMRSLLHSPSNAQVFIQVDDLYLALDIKRLALLDRAGADLTLLDGQLQEQQQGTAAATAAQEAE